MKSSYQKLAKLKEETIYQIKKALEARKIHAKNRNAKIEEGKDKNEIYEIENLQNSITLSDLLDELTKLYEIE